MQKKMLVATVLLTVFMLAATMAYAAAPNVASPMFSYTNSISASLTLNGGEATCSANAKPSNSSTSNSFSAKLQRLEGSNWVTVKTWTDSSTNGEKVYAGGTKTVSTGYTYRVQATLTVKDANGKVLETATVTSLTRSN